MVVNRKVSGKAASMPAGLALGGAVSLGLTLVLSGVLAKLVETQMLAEENIGYGVMVVLLVCSMLGAMVSSGRIKRQRLLVCALSGVVYLLILLSITALFFGGQYEAVGVTALLVLGGSMVTAFLGINGKRGGKRRKITLPHR